MQAVLDALVRGVVAARREARALGHPVAVGFNAVPAFDPADTFWSDLAALADDEFRASLDYVGVDFFPDVFRPLPAEKLAGAVTAVLRSFRDTHLPKAGIPVGVPLRVCENGWPTGPGRPEDRQAATLDTVVRTVAALADELRVDAYAFFSLRDADSHGPGLFHHFGLLRDDYTPKPAFATYRAPTCGDGYSGGVSDTAWPARESRPHSARPASRAIVCPMAQWWRTSAPR